MTPAGDGGEATPVIGSVPNTRVRFARSGTRIIRLSSPAVSRSERKRVHSFLVQPLVRQGSHLRVIEGCKRQSRQPIEIRFDNMFAGRHHDRWAFNRSTPVPYCAHERRTPARSGCLGLQRLKASHFRAQKYALDARDQKRT